MPIDRRHIETITDSACEIDGLRSEFTDPDQHRDLTEAVALLHKVAMACAREYGYDIYAFDDEEPAP